MRGWWILLLSFLPQPSNAETHLVDDFENPARWFEHSTANADLQLSSDTGFKGRSLRLDFKFSNGGYAVLRRDVNLVLPENYAFSFRVSHRGAVPSFLELKLIDRSGENVWWTLLEGDTFKDPWQTVTITKRDIQFGWGSAGGGDLENVAAIEFVITAPKGGSGWGKLWLDEFEQYPLPPAGAPPPTPQARASSGKKPEVILDGNARTGWQPSPRDRHPWIELDFRELRDYGGLVVDWERAKPATNYIVQASLDGKTWTELRHVIAGNGGRDYLYLPRSKSRFLRILVPTPEDDLSRFVRMLIPGAKGSIGIKELAVKPLEWSTTKDSFFQGIALDAPRGAYPRGIRGEPSVWTVIGPSNNALNGLLSGDGILESPADGGTPISIEPFLFVNGRLLTWADVEIQRSLAEGYLPIPSVTWKTPDLKMTITALVPDSSGVSWDLLSRYRVENTGQRTVSATLYLAIRPFQVDPSSQSFNIPDSIRPKMYLIGDVRSRWEGPFVRSMVIPSAYGTPSFYGGELVSNDPVQEVIPPALRVRATPWPTYELEYASGEVRSSHNPPFLRSLVRPSAFGAMSLYGGDLVSDYLSRGTVPGAASVPPLTVDRLDDPQEWASGALAYQLKLGPHERADFVLVAPIWGGTGDLRIVPYPPPDHSFNSELEYATQAWRKTGNRVSIEVPKSGQRAVDAFQSQLYYILINRRFSALQTGSRALARSWIRDGSFISSALLRVGRPDIVKEFIKLYARFQYENGKIPYAVDWDWPRNSGIIASGAHPDPVPEHDSNGEFIFLVAEYFRFTKDRAWAEGQWPGILRGVAYLDSLRHERLTSNYRKSETAKLFGILPPSISHEGYSTKPMHSYWDDFFALSGFKDAVFLANELGHVEEAKRFRAIRDEFARDLAASILAAMKDHNIDYVPGCADLGDFDAASTTIALSPAQASFISKADLEATFDRYYKIFEERKNGGPWEAFSSHEIRNIGAFVRLGWRDRAQELMQYFLEHQTPSGWNQWAEVVWHDTTTAHFIGDLPNSWIGAEYMHAFLDLFAYDRESDRSLVLAAGIPSDWVREENGVAIKSLRTQYGLLSYSLKQKKGTLEARIEKTLDVPPGGLVLRPPLPSKTVRVTVNGKAAKMSSDGETVVRQLPAIVRWSS